MAYSKYGNRKEEDIILRPYKYLRQCPGEGFRTKLIQAFNFWLEIPEEKMTAIIEIIDTLHGASLLMDDVEDNSPLRRGIPTAHRIFGIPAAINASNYVMMVANEKALALNNDEITKIYMDMVLDAHVGQGMEIYFRDNSICPTEEQYRRIVNQKTSVLLTGAVRMMQVFSRNKTDFRKFLNNLGTFFQIHDDYRNLCSNSYAEKKTFAEDLTEGKFSFVIIHALQNNPQDFEILNILKMRTTDLDMKKYCVSLLEKCGSLDYTKKVLKEIQEECRRDIKKFGYNAELVNILETIWKPSENIKK